MMACKIFIMITFIFWKLLQIGTNGAIMDDSFDSRDDDHSQGVNSGQTGWRLVIYPQPQTDINILVRRVDDILNLTCKVEFLESDKNRSIIASNYSDQIFTLSWYLPFGVESSKNRVSNLGSRNSLQLIINKLKETDSGEYKCQTEGLTAGYNENNKFTAQVASSHLRVKPKKGSCSDPMFSCSSGECIAKRYLCDGKKDCKSQEDESQHQCGTWNPCEGKLLCEDGRCISSFWCCDKLVDRNCSVRTFPKCCLQLQSIQVNLDVSQYSHQPQHYSDMGFLQTTIYTVIGCAMAFMFIITIMVIAICRVHLKRTALTRYTHGVDQRNQRQDSWGNIFFQSSTGYGQHSNLLVTYNINNGVQFMGSRPINPPPYSEFLRVPPREGPPPPYESSETVPSAAASERSSNPQTNSSSTRMEPNCRRRTETANNEPTVLDPLLDNDNNNGDINGNNTENLEVQPDRNLESQNRNISLPT